MARFCKRCPQRGLARSGTSDIMRTSLHRRIVAACRLDTLGSVGALRLGGFAAQKQLLTVLCLLRLRYAQSVEHAPIVAMSSARAAEKQKKNTTLRWCSFFGSPNWVNEQKTINNRFCEVKSTKQGVTKQIYDLSALRLCDLTGA